MSAELFKQGAMHESGHIVMAYLAGYTADEVRLIPTEPGSGYTRFNYGEFTLLITSILNSIENGDIFNSLPVNQKQICPKVAFKINGVLLGGPVSEALHLVGKDHDGGLPIDMRGPDLLSIRNIDYFLSHMEKNHPENYIEQSLMRVTAVIQQDAFWTAIEHLSERILASPSMHLTKNEIEASLRESGFLAFIA